MKSNLIKETDSHAFKCEEKERREKKDRKKEIRSRII
jgi:hypothetical protein